MSDRQPWEKQPGETAKAYQAFCVYRDLGAGRSLSIAYERTGKGRSKTGERSGKTEAPRLWERWSSKYQWVERSQAYDRHIEQIRLAAIAQATQVDTIENCLAEIEELRAVSQKSGKGAMINALKALKKIDEVLTSGVEIKTVEDVYKMASTAKTLATLGFDLWANALGVKDLMTSARDRVNDA